jgi:hypothetical protein
MGQGVDKGSNYYELQLLYRNHTCCNIFCHAEHTNTCCLQQTTHSEDRPCMQALTKHRVASTCLTNKHMFQVAQQVTQRVTLHVTERGDITHHSARHPTHQTTHHAPAHQLELLAQVSQAL